MIPEARAVRLSRKERDVLEARCRSPVTIQRDLKRARIVLLAAAGRSTRSIAKEVRVQPRIVSHWRRRFADDGLEGLQDKPRPGKEPIYTKETDKRILALLDESPPKGFARWTGPLLAEELCDIDVQYVWRFLRNQKIDLKARKSWCESNDPDFASKAADVVGLYIDLFAALDVATGKVLGEHKKRRRRVEFLGFMDKVVAAFPDRELHVVLDNLNTHKKNERWLKKHTRVHFHFTPTRASWLNQIETWFSILQGQSLSGASFTAVSQLQEHIDAFISAWNENAEPFVWTKKKVRQRRFKGRRITQL